MLQTDQSIRSDGTNVLVSDGCAYRLVMQGILFVLSCLFCFFSFLLVINSLSDDGNLVQYNSAGVPLWASNTPGQGAGPFSLV